MKNVVKILLYLFIAYLPIKVHGQNDYARQFEVMSQVDSLVKEKNFGESNSNIANLTIDAMDNFMARNYNKAIPQFIQIVDYTKVNRPNEYVQLVAWQNVLAMAYMNIGDYKKTEEYYLSSLDILESKNLQNEKIYRNVLDGLGLLYFHVHNYDKANRLNGRAKILYEEALDFSDEYVRCLSNGALIKNALGYNTVTKMFVDVALRQAKKNLSDTIAISSSVATLGQLFGESQKRTLDHNFYIQSRIIPYVTLLTNSFTIYLQIGYFSDAVRAVKESIRVSEHYGLRESSPYNNLGTLYLCKSNFPQAAEWFLKGYSLCKTSYERAEVGMNTVLGLFLSHDKRAASFACEVSSEMKQNIRNNFVFLNSMERVSYWKHFENYFPMMNLVIYESRKTDCFGVIYDNIIEAKGLLLRSSNNIRDAVLKSNNSNDKATFQTLKMFRQKLQSERDSLKRINITKEIEKLDKELTRNVSTYANFVRQNNVSWMNIRDALSEKDVAIEFYNIPLIYGLDSIQTLNGEPRYCAIVLKKGYAYPHIIPLCEEKLLTGLEQYDLYSTDVLYNAVWKPLETELAGMKRIFFSADGELHKIGIENAVLPDGKRMKNSFSLFRLSSTRELVTQSKTILPESAVLYGGLLYDIQKDDLIVESRSGVYHPSNATRTITMDNLRYGVKNLDGTKKEVESIAEYFNDNCRLITGLPVRKNRLRLWMAVLLMWFIWLLMGSFGMKKRRKKEIM